MSLALLDWRRRVAALYAAVRANPDPEVAHRTWRLGRDELFAHHPSSPLLDEARAGFDGLRYAPYDPARRSLVEVDAEVAPALRSASTGTDGLVSLRRIGRVELLDFGSLDLWWLEGYGGGLFLPVKDPNPATYGGGRYLLDTAKGADLGGRFDPVTGRGALVVDLNFAYNPSCAYDPAWECPLAPPENTLRHPVEAGELAA